MSLSADEKEALLKGVSWEPMHPVTRGGQSCGIPHLGIRLLHKELQFEVACNYYRSLVQNREMCLVLFELFLDELK